MDTSTWHRQRQHLPAPPHSPATGSTCHTLTAARGTGPAAHTERLPGHREELPYTGSNSRAPNRVPRPPGPAAMHRTALPRVPTASGPVTLTTSNSLKLALRRMSLKRRSFIILQPWSENRLAAIARTL